MGLTDKIAALRKWKPRPEVLCCAPLPLPMHGLAPRVVMGDKWWDKVRHEAYRSTNYHCIACSSAPSLLHGHECYDIDYLCGRMTYTETVPLCEPCHQFVHQGYLRVQLEQGVVTKEHFDSVLRHGHMVVSAAGLPLEPPYSGPCAEWGDWRLVIGKREYRPLHKDFEAYRKHYNA